MKKNTIRVRTVLVMLFVVLFVGVFAIRLFDLQVLRASALTEEAIGKRSIPLTLYSNRGQIVDRNGVILADSIMRYNVTVSPKNTKDFIRETDRSEVTVTPQQAAVEIAALTGQQPEDILKVVADALAADPKSDFAYIKKAVDVDTFRALNALEIPWLYFEQAPGRSYPNGAVAGNLLGFVGEDGLAQAGLELGWDECLAGVNGQEIYQRGADGVRIPGSTVTTVEAQNGGELELTIDSDLQWFLQQVIAKQVDKFSGEWGIAVVQDVKTGKLLGVADYPTVDPNNIDSSSSENRGSRAFMSPYEPGSTVKTLSAAMIVDAGVANPNTPVYSPYRIEFPNGAKMTNNHIGPTNLTLTGVLEQSANSGISQLGTLIDANTRYDYLEKFGLTSVSASGYPAESSGILAEPEIWDNQSFYNITFGQAIATTAIQMSSSYQAIGNKGKLIPATIVEKCTLANGDVIKPDVPQTTQVISPEAARTTIDMLENFVSKSWANKEISIPGYRVAMKTGTAEQPDGQGGYKSLHVVSNIGLLPADDPQFVISVVISEPKLTQSFAVPPPVYKSIEQHLIKRYRILPSEGSPPDLPLRY